MPHITLTEGVPGILGPMLFRPETAKVCFVSVNELYTRISSRKGTQSFQAYAAASGSGVIPAPWADAGLESPGEVACITG